MASRKYDDVLLRIIKEQTHLTPFLDAVFGCLYRCTDFYEIQNHPTDELGFPPGVAEDVVMKVFKKWENIAKENKAASSDLRSPATAFDFPLPDLQKEVTTESEELCERSEPRSDKQEKPFTTKDNEEKCENTNDEKKIQNSESSDNGAIGDGYQWSQSIRDLAIQITVPSHIMKARDMKVAVSSKHISISALTKGSKDESFTVIDRELSYKTIKEESLWNLESGKHVQVYLKKAQYIWWESLFTDEPKIDLLKIDSSKLMHDLPQEEQMTIQKPMCNEERKRQGLVQPESENLDLEKILKESWNKYGSPF